MKAQSLLYNYTILLNGDNKRISSTYIAQFLKVESPLDKSPDVDPLPPKMKKTPNP